MGVVIFAVLAMGTMQYIGEVRSLRENVIEKSLISLQPVITLATRNIDGGNLMNLKNQSAVDMYKTNANMFYLKIYGTSLGSPKTDFSEAIPPAQIENEYMKSDVDDAHRKLYVSKMAAMGDKDVIVDATNMVVYIYKQLELTNGGYVFAVFSAKELGGVWLKVVGT
jgi:hypothetical protein